MTELERKLFVELERWGFYLGDDAPPAEKGLQAAIAVVLAELRSLDQEAYLEICDRFLNTSPNNIAGIVEGYIAAFERQHGEG